MKVIQSAGGPLMALDVEHLQRWRGSSGKNFTNEDPRFGTDYESATYFAHGRHKPPCFVALMDGSYPLVILMSMPLETAIIAKGREFIYIAQVDYADPEWNFDSVSAQIFDNATFLSSNEIKFLSQSCSVILFDAAYDGREVGDDCLIFDMYEGDYVLSTAEYQPDDRTGLIFYKIQKIKGATVE